MTEAHLEGAKLQYANLSGVILEKAHLENADLRNANLEKAVLVEADVNGTNLENANLLGAFRNYMKNWKEAKRQGVKLDPPSPYDHDIEY